MPRGRPWVSWRDLSAGLGTPWSLHRSQKRFGACRMQTCLLLPGRSYFSRSAVTQVLPLPVMSHGMNEPRRPGIKSLQTCCSRLFCIVFIGEQLKASCTHRHTQPTILCNKSRNSKINFIFNNVNSSRKKHSHIIQTTHRKCVCV